MRLRPSTVIENAAEAYLRYGRIVSTDKNRPYSRHLLRLAVLDAIAIDLSIQRAKLILTSILLGGTLTLGAGLLALLIDFQTFDWRMLVLLVGGGILQGVIVLPCLFRRIDAASPGLRIALLTWGAVLLGSSSLVGTQSLERGWSRRRLSFLELINVSAAAYLLVTIITVALAGFAVAAINVSERKLLLGWNAEGTAIFELMWAASLINRSKGYPVPVDLTWAVVDALQQAARAVTLGMSKQIPISDQYNRDVYQGKLDDIAETIYSIQLRVLIGSSEEDDNETSRTAFSIASSLLFQDLAAAPTIRDDERKARRSTLKKGPRRRFVAIAIDAGKAVGPVLAVKASEYLGLLPPSVLTSSLSTLAVAWLIIRLISLIEPNYKETIVGVQSLLDASSSAKK